MADRLRVRRRPRRTTGVTAAAKILAPTRRDEPQPEAWAHQAWGFRNAVGELRHAETWLGNSMGRARLVAAVRRAPGAEPEPLPEEHPAQQYMAQLAGGVGGQSALLRSFGTYLMTPGIGLMCGFDPRDGGGPTWQVRDTTEVRLSRNVRGDDGRPVYEVQTGDETTDWLPLTDGLVVQVHRPDPQKHWRPDSPVRGALGLLDELFVLTQAIKATAVSRLAGAGILPLPSELELDDMTWDQFVDALLATFSEPIKDRGVAAAVAPYPIRMKGEWIDKIKPVHFHTPFDEHAVTLRAELIQRLATAMDMPARALTGEQENHWGKALTAEEGVKIHVQPNLELVCDGITRGYLLPALLSDPLIRDRDLDLPNDGGRELAEAIQREGAQLTTSEGQVIAWYDLSDFFAKPDRGDAAQEAYDRFEVTGDTLRAETGLSEFDAPDKAELHERLLITVAQGGDATLQRAALIKLGVFTEEEVPEPAAAPAPGQAPDQPGDGEDEDEGEAPPSPVPDTEPDDPAPSEDPPPPPARVLPRAADAELVALACEPVVARAIERAGNRLRNVTARRRAADHALDAAPMLMHTVMNAAAVRPLDTLLADAWDGVPELAERCGADATQLGMALDVYTRGLITNRRPHSWELFRAYVMANPPAPNHATGVLAALAGMTS